MSVMLEKFVAAHKKSTPLIGISTSDQAAVMESVIGLSEMQKLPLLRWDVIRALVGLNKAGQAAVARVIGDQDAVAATRGAADMLDVASKLPPESMVFMFNAMRWLNADDTDSRVVAQGIANLRDLFKSNGQCLVMLAPSFSLPPEIAQDVMLLDDPLPSTKDLEQIVLDEYEQHEAKAPDGATMARAVEALRGLAAFPARQVVALNLTKKKGELNISGLWSRKVSIIGQTPGLSVWTGKSTFKDIGGCGNIKNFLTRLFNGRNRPVGIGFADELEKAVAGSSGDTSGVSQEMHGQLLQWMTDTDAFGLLFVGHPGAAKTAVAQAIGNEAGVPLIAMNITAMKASLVGESTRNLNNALRVIDAVTDGRALIVGTCNRISGLSPELRRRFSQVMFFDLPTMEERDMIWPIYLRKYELDDTQQKPADTNWSGADIRKCCEIAWRLNCSLLEASQYVVPVAIANPEAIKRLREEATNKYISAAYEGFYTGPADEQQTSTRSRAVRG
jgi:hypothetical protein